MKKSNLTHRCTSSSSSPVLHSCPPPSSPSTLPLLVGLAVVAVHDFGESNYHPRSVPKPGSFFTKRSAPTVEFLLLLNDGDTDQFRGNEPKLRGLVLH